MQRTVRVCDRYGTTRDVQTIRVTVQAAGELEPTIFEGDLGPRALERALNLAKSIFAPCKSRPTVDTVEDEPNRTA